MAPKISVSILIEQGNRVFFPGETVKGAVEVNVLRKTSINSVKIKAKGISEVKWVEYSRDQDAGLNYGSNNQGILDGLARSRPETRAQKESYYETEVVLFGEGASGGNLSDGIHKFDFSYELPTNIPCSFEGKYGYVRHSCKAFVDVGGKVFDLKPFALLSVGVLSDLNHKPKAKKEISERKEKNKKALFGKKDTPKFSLTFNIDHTGFVPGENLIINAKCSNGSRQATKKTKLELFQTVIYKTNLSKKAIQKKICSKTHPGVDPGTDDIWCGAELTIPPLPPSGFPECSLINIAYHLQFTVCPSFPSSDISVIVPIIIGTIPLKEIFGTLVPAYPGTINGSSYAPNTLFPWTEEYKYLPPPAFRAFTTKKTRSDDDDNDYLDGKPTNNPTKYLDSKKDIKFSPFSVYFNQEVPKGGINKSNNEIKLESMTLTEKL